MDVVLDKPCIFEIYTMNVSWVSAVSFGILNKESIFLGGLNRVNITGLQSLKNVLGTLTQFFNKIKCEFLIWLNMCTIGIEKRLDFRYQSVLQHICVPHHCTGERCI